jgi:hypothetical protein
MCAVLTSPALSDVAYFLLFFLKSSYRQRARERERERERERRRRYGLG